MIKKTIVFICILYTCVLPVGYAQKEKAYLPFETESATIYDACFTAKGGALGVADDKTVRVYTTDSRKLLGIFENGHNSRILAIAIAQDSSVLISAGTDSTIVLWDFVERKKLQTLTHQKGIVTSVQLSADNKYLLSGGTDNKVYLYDLEQQQVAHGFADHLDDVTAVKFSPDERYVASSGGDKLVNLYDVVSKKLIASLPGHKDWVRDVAFSADGKTLLSCGDDGRLIFWNVSDISNVRKFYHSKVSFSWTLSTAFFRDSKIYAYGNLNGQGKISTPFGGYAFKVDSPITKIVFKPNEAVYLKAVVATKGNGVLLLDAKHLKPR